MSSDNRQEDSRKKEENVRTESNSAVKILRMLITAVICAAAAVFLIFAAGVNVHADNDDTVSMYRMFNDATGEHLYTTSVNERNELVLHYGWTYEGIGWTGPVKSATPVYRVYDPESGEHHYTVNRQEKQALIDEYHWNDEGIAWYSDDRKTVPLYRLFNKESQSPVSSHNFTADSHERDVLKENYGWTGEGIAWFGVTGAIDSDDHPMTIYKGVDLSDIYSYQYFRSNHPEVVASVGSSDAALIRYFADEGLKAGLKGKASFDQNRYDEIADKFARNGHVIEIDPGHQSADVDTSAMEPNGPGSSVMKMKDTNGTQGTYTGIPEYQLNLDISKMLRDALEEKGYTVYLTREDNSTAISCIERAQKATKDGADILVRIHANGGASSASGACALVGSASNRWIGGLHDESSRLAASILNHYCQTTGLKNGGVYDNDTMTGNNWSTVPVTILEMGYMTNMHDDYYMADAGNRQKMVEGIVEGIDEYFGY